MDDMLLLVDGNFYPRPPRGGRPYLEITGNGAEGISIHALREEGDLWMICFCWSMEISIHALREEGDPIWRSPETAQKEFLSTPSARRATTFDGLSCVLRKISIHALREEGDL
mgnify:CR=1 FL=1